MNRQLDSASSQKKTRWLSRLIEPVVSPDPSGRLRGLNIDCRVWFAKRTTNESDRKSIVVAQFN
jgi:hypothetical protein